MCDYCDDIKSAFLSKEQKSCLPSWLQNAKPYSIYEDYVDTPTGGFLPIMTLIPLILKGIAVAALSTSAISGVADTIINSIKGKGLSHIPIDYKYPATQNNIPNNNTDDFSYDLGITCPKSNIITQTDIPHQLWIKEKGNILFAGKCNLCNSHKQVLLNDFQKAYLPDYLTNDLPGSKYTNFIIDEKTGGLIPIQTALFPITAGKFIPENSKINQQNISNSMLKLFKSNPKNTIKF